MARLMAPWEDPKRRARLLFLLWLTATGFTLFGFGVIFYRALFPPR